MVKQSFANVGKAHRKLARAFAGECAGQLPWTLHDFLWSFPNASPRKVPRTVPECWEGDASSSNMCFSPRPRAQLKKNEHRASVKLLFLVLQGSPGESGSHIQIPVFSQVFWLLGGRGGSSVFTESFGSSSALKTPNPLCFHKCSGSQNIVFS